MRAVKNPKSRIKHEYELKKALEECGFFVVRVPASGRSYHFDLVAFKAPYLFVIEVKSTSTGRVRLTEQERKALREASEKENVCPLVAVRWVGDMRKKMGRKWEVQSLLCSEEALTLIRRCLD